MGVVISIKEVPINRKADCIIKQSQNISSLATDKNNNFRYTSSIQ